MKFIICLDDNNGMLFNNRRQSRDSAVITDIIKDLNEEKLNILPFSQQLFEGLTDNINIVSTINENGIYFAENIDIVPFAGKADEIIVYRWNRIYPSDFTCDVDFSCFKILKQSEFMGSSHDKISKSVYGR